MDLSRYQGLGIFGPAYRVMLENDCHAPGSVDRVLVEQMILLNKETAACLYSQYTQTSSPYRNGSRPGLEKSLGELVRPGDGVERRVERIISFCARLGENISDDLDTMQVGGTEEQIIARGSDWCTDVARVACILCQVAGLPSRIVYLADLTKAYSGHAIIEAFHRGQWGAADSSTGVLYRHGNSHPASTWDLMRDPALIHAHGRASAIYTNPGQFSGAAIANYSAGERDHYDYTVSGLNTYTRSILEQSYRGWPGGLRWLHQEEEKRGQEPSHFTARRIGSTGEGRGVVPFKRSRKPRKGS